MTPTTWCQSQDVRADVAEALAILAYGSRYQSRGQLES